MLNDLAGLLQRMTYTPQQGDTETKQLRAKYAGNPAMQQQLAIDDRFHTGKGMAQANPGGAMLALAGSVPYDMAKLAYFNGPKPVKQGLARLTERMFPGEGFNDQTTSRPDIRQYGGMLSGMLQGWTQ